MTRNVDLIYCSLHTGRGEDKTPGGRKWIWLVKIRSGRVMLGQALSCKVRMDRAGSGEVKSGQVSSGEVRSTHIWSG